MLHRSICRLSARSCSIRETKFALKKKKLLKPNTYYQKKLWRLLPTALLLQSYPRVGLLLQGAADRETLLFFREINAHSYEADFFAKLLSEI
jgi:hypothetical protein